MRAGLRLVQGGGVHAVKLEGGMSQAGKVRALVGEGVPVVGHVGLLPQTACLGAGGGFSLRGRSVTIDCGNGFSGIESEYIDEPAKQPQSRRIGAVLEVRNRHVMRPAPCRQFGRGYAELFAMLAHHLIDSHAIMLAHFFLFATLEVDS